MTTFSLAIREEQYQILSSHLFPASGTEHAAYVLCREAQIGRDPWSGTAHCTFLATDVVTVPNAEIVDRSSAHVTWGTAGFARVLKKAADEGKVAGVVHSHRGSPARFSRQDDGNEPDLVQMAVNRNGAGTKILSVVFDEQRRIAARVWLAPQAGEAYDMRLVRVTGSRIQVHSTTTGELTHPRILHRQALAFGPALNEHLRLLRVGVVGCGGTGSAVAMLLARLGVGHLALFDKDVVDETNLNRLHGATQADANANRLKVEVVAGSIANMGLGVRTIPIDSWVGGEECRDALRACDVVFGCTDDHDGRLLLNRLAYYYLVPADRTHKRPFRFWS